MAETYDAVIIGVGQAGDPQAGDPQARALAKEGRRVVIVERDRSRWI